jgi:phosphoglycolate phosphatase
VEGRRVSRPRAVLFDFDGTLIDSAPDIHAATNLLLARQGLGPLTLAQVKSMIGHGVRKLVERAYAACGRPLDDAELDAEFATMMEIYFSHLTVLTRLMPGAREAVDALRADGVALALVTNKPQRFSEAILDHLGLLDAFGAVIGGDAGYVKKPAPDMLLAALERLGVAAGEAAMIGDSGADVESARAAGLPVVIVEGGYTTVPAAELGADAVVASLDEVMSALRELDFGDIRV